MTQHTRDDIAMILMAAGSGRDLAGLRQGWAALAPDLRAQYLRMADAALAIRDEAVSAAVIDVGYAIEA